MRHGVTECRRRGLTRALAGALVFTVLGLGSVACGEQGDAPAASAPGAEVAAPMAVAPMSESEPVQIEIPALGVTSDVMDLGLQPDGSMEVPPGAYPAGWYTGAPTPGELGPAIIAAHVDWNGEPGVFHQIDQLEPGDDVIVHREDGSNAISRLIA
jgi:sortase family protein